MVAGASVVTEIGSLASVMLALVAVITGIVKVSSKIVDLQIQVAISHKDIADIRARVERMEYHLAASPRP